jgi:hypothetical protein
MDHISSILDDWTEIRIRQRNYSGHGILLGFWQ